MGLFGGGGNIARRAGEQAAKSIDFKPVDVAVEGLGGVTFDGARPEFQLTPEQQAQMGAFGGLVQPGAAGAGALTGGVQGAGAAGLEQAQAALSALGSFDPMQSATQRFNQLDAALQARRDQDRSALESRLLAQGRLDSTAGARQLAEYEAGIERERADLLNRQFGEAQAAQTNLANIASQLTGTGVGAQQGLFSQALGGLQGQQAVVDPLFRMGAFGADLANMRTQAQIAKSGAISGHNQMAAGAGGGSMLGGLVQGGLTALGGAFGGPLGAAAGSAVGGMFGGGGGGGAFGLSPAAGAFTGSTYGTNFGSQQSRMLAEQMF